MSMLYLQKGVVSDKKLFTVHSAKSNFCSFAQVLIIDDVFKERVAANFYSQTINYKFFYAIRP